MMTTVIFCRGIRKSLMDSEASMRSLNGELYPEDFQTHLKVGNSAILAIFPQIMLDQWCHSMKKGASSFSIILGRASLPLLVYVCLCCHGCQPRSHVRFAIFAGQHRSGSRSVYMHELRCAGRFTVAFFPIINTIHMWTNIGHFLKCGFRASDMVKKSSEIFFLVFVRYWCHVLI